MTTNNTLIFLFGTLFGYLWSLFMFAKFIVRLGYKSFSQIPENKNKDELY